MPDLRRPVCIPDALFGPASHPDVTELQYGFHRPRRPCPHPPTHGAAMRYAIVTETWPPEVNGVALTALALEQGLRARGHAVSLARPRQVPGQVPAAAETPVRGANLPRYPGLQFGLPATRQLRQLWRDERPDAISVATEGPLGWSALRASRRLGVPAARQSVGAGKRVAVRVELWVRPIINKNNL